MKVQDILNLSREEAEALHKELYNTPEGNKALDVIKGNFNALIVPQVEKEATETEAAETEEKKPKAKK